MTDPQVITATVASLTAAAVTILNAWYAARDRSIAREQRSRLSDKADVNIAKTEQVHTLVNGGATRQAERIEWLERQVTRVQQKLDRLEDVNRKQAKE